MKLRWEVQSHRSVAKCGDADIGAIYPGNNRVRWRIWVTKNMNPIESTAASEEAAKAEVERRFSEFLTLARLQPVPETAR